MPRHRHRTEKEIARTVSVLTLGLVALGVVFGQAATAIAYEVAFGVYEMPERDITAGLVYYDEYPEIEARFPRETPRFRCNGYELQGYLYANPDPKGIIVFTHGMHSYADRHILLLESLYHLGYTVFAFDLSGTAESGGGSLMGFPEVVIDLESALRFIDGRDDLKGLSKYLIGFSWGAYASAAVLNVYQDVKAVVSIEGCNEPLEAVVKTSRIAVSFLADLQKPFVEAYQKLKFGRYADYTAVRGINDSGVPAFIINGEHDTIFPYDDSVSTYDHFGELKGDENESWLASGKSHVSMLYSDEADDYQLLYYDKEKKLKGDKEALKALVASIDDWLFSEPNPVLVGKIGAFLAEHA